MTAIKIEDEPKVEPTKPEVKSLAEEAVTVSPRDRFLKKGKKVITKAIYMDGEEVELKIAGMDTSAFNDLQHAHPKRKNHDLDNSLGNNSDTFPPALFEASVIDPKLTLDEWTDIWKSPNWTPGELGHLLAIVMDVQTSGFDVPFGVRG